MIKLPLELTKAKVDGWLIHSWMMSDQRPYDEGYAAAASGIDSDTTNTPSTSGSTANVGWGGTATKSLKTERKSS